MTRPGWRLLLAACAAAPFAVSAARAELAVSANDGKAILIDGVTTVPPSPKPDYVAVIDLAGSLPRVIGEVKVPTSVVGPPQSVAIAPDESFALVTGAMKIDPADATKTVPDDKLTVIDLKASPPVVLQTLEAGKGAAGVSINKTGTLALVANRSEGTISVFAISGRTLSPAGKVDLGNDKSGPSHAVFTPNGKMALVTRDGDNKISVLAIDGSKVEYSKRDVSAGLRPYGIDITPKGDVAVVANIGMGGGDADTISVIDVAATPPRVIETVTVGQTPEGLKLSPDGKHVAVTVMNGSNKPKASPFFNDFGLLRIFRLEEARLSPVADAKVGHWCQGTAWNRAGTLVLVQCMVENEIAAFRFDGSRLEPMAPIKLDASPAGIRTAEP